ncbi:MAG: hypothetical protein E7Z84_08110 [Methanosphaera stadtmanae]|nr:hypothetical protein [Methanosphaera stadtmanae]
MNKKIMLILLISICLITTLATIAAAGYSSNTFKITNQSEDYLIKAPGLFEEIPADSVVIVSKADPHNTYTFYKVGSANDTLNPKKYLYNESNTIVDIIQDGNLTVYKILTSIDSDDFSGKDNYQTYAVYTKGSDTYYAYTPYYAEGEKYNFNGRALAEIFSYDYKTIKRFITSIEPV